MRRPVILVLIGIVSVQVGASIAKRLFDEVSPTGLVWLRLTASLLVLLALARPRLRGRTRDDWAVAVGFGLSLATMNWAIYQSFARIPLGVAVTLEFTGPLLVAVLGSRRARDLAWVGLAGVGVALLGLDGGSLTWSGVAFALLAGAAWAAYILLSAHTGRRWEGLDGLVVASAVAAVLLVPLVLAGSPGELTAWHVLVLGALVGVMSSVVPYSLELIALRTLAPATLGVLMSLEPAAAALAGLVVVGERLGPWQWVAIGCVVVASAGATRSGARAVVGDPTDSGTPVQPPVASA